MRAAAAMSRLSRRAASLILLLALAGMLAADLLAYGAPDPFRAPAPLALWSGTAATGGFCATAPN